MSKIRTKIVAIALVFAAFFMIMPSAGATPDNPGDNTSCTAGTDHCSAWLPSANIPCMVYNVLWDHVWAGAPGGDAFWRKQVDRYWTCGGVTYIANVTVAYTLDTAIPHNEVVFNTGKIETAPGFWSVYFGDTGNVVQWSRCKPDPNTNDPWRMSNSVWVDSSDTPGHMFLVGTRHLIEKCRSYDQTTIRQVADVYYDGSYMMWDHYNRLSSDGNPHTFVVWTFY